MPQIMVTTSLLHQIRYPEDNIIQIECHEVKKKNKLGPQEGANSTRLSWLMVYLWMAGSVPSAVLFQQEHRHSICPPSRCHEGTLVLKIYSTPHFHLKLKVTEA